MDFFKIQQTKKQTKFCTYVNTVVEMHVVSENSCSNTCILVIHYDSSLNRWLCKNRKMSMHANV